MIAGIEIHAIQLLETTVQTNEEDIYSNWKIT